MNQGGRRESAGRPQRSTNRATKEQEARLPELTRLHTEMTKAPSPYYSEALGAKRAH